MKAPVRCVRAVKTGVVACIGVSEKGVQRLYSVTSGVRV